MDSHNFQPLAVGAHELLLPAHVVQEAQAAQAVQPVPIENQPAPVVAAPEAPTPTDVELATAARDMVSPKKILDLKFRFDKTADPKADKAAQKQALIDQYAVFNTSDGQTRPASAEVKSQIAELMDLSYDVLEERASYPAPPLEVKPGVAATVAGAPEQAPAVQAPVVRPSQLRKTIKPPVSIPPLPPVPPAPAPIPTTPTTAAPALRLVQGGLNQAPVAPVAPTEAQNPFTPEYIQELRQQAQQELAEAGARAADAQARLNALDVLEGNAPAAPAALAVVENTPAAGEPAPTEVTTAAEAENKKKHEQLVKKAKIGLGVVALATSAVVHLRLGTMGYNFADGILHNLQHTAHQLSQQIEDVASKVYVLRNK